VNDSPDNPLNKNPWLVITASDYEGHMSSPNVGQLAFLSESFKFVLTETRPKSILVVGCTTGNGLEHVDFKVTVQVAAVDINESYLAVLRERFAASGDCVETICSDINSCRFYPESFDLIHCALLFEYVDVEETLTNIENWLAPEGRLSTILQLDDAQLGAVSETPFVSMKLLANSMNLIEPKQFDKMAYTAGLSLVAESIKELPSGKRFRLSTHRRQS
jgi:ubiquinone/menaquinone biosynthesis C-methylase UbiE